MNAELVALRARLTALQAGLVAATGGPVLQGVAQEAMALAGQILPGISSEWSDDDDWAVTRDGPIGSIIGPDVALLASYDGLAPTSVRIFSGDRILHVASGDPTGGGPSLLAELGVGNLDLASLDPSRLGTSTPDLDEYGRRYIGAMRVTLVDSTELVAHEVIDELGASRPMAEVAVEELEERLERGIEGAVEAAQEPGETESSTVGLPGDTDETGVPRPSVGGAGALAGAAGAVTAVAASAAIKRLMQAARRPDEPSPDPGAGEPAAEPCAFCGTAVAASDRFCRGCGRPHDEARSAGWAPTHVVPAGGLYAFERPDPSLAPTGTLEAGLPVQVRQTLGAWSEVVSADGSTAWVDGRFLDNAP